MVGCELKQTVPGKDTICKAANVSKLKWELSASLLTVQKNIFTKTGLGVEGTRKVILSWIKQFHFLELVIEGHSLYASLDIRWQKHSGVSMVSSAPAITTVSSNSNPLT